MIYSLHRFGISFNEYFMYHFWELNKYGREQFINFKLLYGYCDYLNDSKVRDTFEDKFSLYKLLKQFFKREVLGVYNSSDYDLFVQFISKHNSFIYKPNKGYQGRGIKIYHNFSGNIEKLFNSLLSEGAFVVEELIVQDSIMSAFHPKSINTLRIHTITINEMVYILGCAIRMGVGDSEIDNAGSGGIFATVDSNTGIVCSSAQDRIGSQYIIHPDSNYTIIGFAVPEWNKAIEVVSSAAKVVKEATSISWDLAYNIEKEWIIVEGNDIGGPHLFQAPLRKGLKSEMISLIDKYLDNKNN